MRNKTKAYDPKVLGARVREIRQARIDGMSVESLARVSGLTKETVSRLELGKSRPDFNTMCAIADALGVTLDDLAGRSLRKYPQAHAVSQVSK